MSADAAQINSTANEWTFKNCFVMFATWLATEQPELCLLYVENKSSICYLGLHVYWCRFD